MTKQGTWLEQWERVQRYYSLIEKFTKKGVPPANKDSPELNFLDQHYAFFIFCYHLKDWIDNDTTLNLTRKKADKFIKGNTHLEICGDICNGIKHLKRNEERIRRAWQPEFEKKATVSRKIVEGKLVSKRWKAFVLTDIGKIDVFDLATECMDKWKEFIRQNIGEQYL